MATTRFAVAPMKAAQVPKPGADFQIVEREIPKPGAGQVLIKVQACGVCHSDVLTKEGALPGIQYPRVPGGRRFQLEKGAASRSRLARRPRWHVPPVPPWGFSKLRESENFGHQL
jgi:hypothetical protein